MRLQLKTVSDVVGLSIKRNKAHDGREAFVDLEIAVKQNEASKWGEDFEALAFATMRVNEDDSGNSIAFLVDTIKPGHRVVFEHHAVNIAGQQINEQPELMNIRTVDGEARVIARVRLPISVDKTALINELITKVGQTVSVEFNPQQLTIGFTRIQGEQAAAAVAAR